MMTSAIQTPEPETTGLLRPSFDRSITLSNPDGLHMRPAQALTRLSSRISELTGSKVLVNAATSQSKTAWVDIAQEYDMANNGFGLKYYSLLSLCLLDGQKINLGLANLVCAQTADRIFCCFEKLLSDSMHLEWGGELKDFYKIFTSDLQVF